MTKVLVTGGSGFIGTTLAEHFAKNTDFEVVRLDREAPREAWKGQEVVQCDLLDRQELEDVVRWERPDTVLHIAAQARVDPSVTDPLTTYDLNVGATINVLKACKKVGVKHIVAASSEATYGRAREYPCVENNDFNPANPYAASKICTDVLVQQFCHVIPTCVVRSGMGWGPRSNPKEQVVGKFIVKALQGKSLGFPADRDFNHPTRDLNHVADFAAGVQKIVEKRATGVFNLSGGREYTVLEIAKRVIEAVGKGRIEYSDSFTYRPSEEGFRTWLDVSKAERVLGHKPRYHLEGKALKDTVAWYAKHLDGSYWPA